MTHEWTRERPAGPGWYWFKDDCESKPRLLLIEQTTVAARHDLQAYFPGSQHAEEVVHMTGKWAGPVMPPAGA